jgi:hypothetical protein
MSCRIDRVVSAESFVELLVSGQITGDHVDTVRGVLEQEPGGFVARSEDHGTELRNCPPYIREWVARERAGKEDVEDA